MLTFSQRGTLEATSLPSLLKYAALNPEPPSAPCPVPQLMWTRSLTKMALQIKPRGVNTILKNHKQIF